MAFPWTAQALLAASEIADTLTEIDAHDKETLKASIPDLVGETPRVQVGIARFRQVAPRLKKESLDILREVLIGIISEATIKLILGR